MAIALPADPAAGFGIGVLQVIMWAGRSKPTRTEPPEPAFG